MLATSAVTSLSAKKKTWSFHSQLSYVSLIEEKKDEEERNKKRASLQKNCSKIKCNSSVPSVECVLFSFFSSEKQRPNNTGTFKCSISYSTMNLSIFNFFNSSSNACPMNQLNIYLYGTKVPRIWNKCQLKWLEKLENEITIFYFTRRNYFAIKIKIGI